MIDTSYFKEYRQKLGFTSQGGVKEFFAAKDIVPMIDYGYIESLNGRLIEIITKINDLVVENIRTVNINEFCVNNVDSVFEKLKQNNVISKLNNQGRRPEEVYFSWMRGMVVSTYFLNALSAIFSVDVNKIDLIGDDDLVNIEFFKRTPKADLQVNLPDGEALRVEVQSGFQGVNDIKQHKVLEARRIKSEKNISSLVIHFDLFNGQVAFVKLNDISDDNVNWITRINASDGVLYNIDQNLFLWRITEKPPRYSDLFFDIE